MSFSAPIAKVVRKTTLDEQGTDFAYWQSQPYASRLKALVEIRESYHAWKDGTPAQNMILHPDLREFIELLNRNGVHYLVVGGYAVAFHGHPRYTKDLDLWLEQSEQAAADMVRILEEFGFGSLGLVEADFLEPGTIIQLGHPPNRIYLLVGLSEMDFDTAYAGRIETEIDGLQLPFVDLEQLRAMKRRAGRPRDLDDLENLQ